MDIKPIILTSAASLPTANSTSSILTQTIATISSSASALSSSTAPASYTNSSPTTAVATSHLPLDYSLGNFKPAIASDFPGPFVNNTTATAVSAVSQPSLQLRDISVLTTMAATIPSPTQLLQQRAHQHHHQQHQQQSPSLATEATSQNSSQQQDYQPVSAFKAVLPKKKTTDGKFKNFEWFLENIEGSFLL